MESLTVQVENEELRLAGFGLAKRGVGRVRDEMLAVLKAEGTSVAFEDLT
jgi:hypothetical protein